MGSKSYGLKKLFDQATFSVNEGEKIGIIGPNGAGKSTLFKIILKLEELDEGRLVQSNQLRMTHLAQEDFWEPGLTLEQYVSGMNRPIWEIQSYANQLGIDESHFSQVIASMSGGFRMRCKLLKLYAADSNLMLLDEPTNYLDMETLLLLEKFILNYKGALLLISHDREFLKRVTDHTMEVEAEQITKYSGSIEDYFEQKAMLQEHLEKQKVTQANKRKEILNFVSRFGAKATKAKQAQSKLKRLSKMQVIESKPILLKAQIRIPPPERVGKVAFSVNGLQLGYDHQAVLSQVNLEIMGGQKLAIVGNNGVGKSTLLKGIHGLLAPQAGNVEFGYQMKTSYYGQHVSEELDLKLTVIDELESAAGTRVNRQDVLDLAGSLLFSGEDVHKPIRILSGGEKARVSLGKILLSKSPILLLDEPTNHLDFYTVESLSQALSNYDGTVVFVCHDRSLVKQVATRIVEVRSGRAIDYPGAYDEYLWSLENGALSIQDKNIKNPLNKTPEGSSKIRVRKSKAVNTKQMQKRQRDIEKKMSQLEREIETKNKLLQQLNQKLIQENNAKLFKELTSTQESISRLESKWMTLSEQIESND